MAVCVKRRVGLCVPLLLGIFHRACKGQAFFHPAQDIIRSAVQYALEENYPVAFEAALCKFEDWSSASNGATEPEHDAIVVCKLYQ